MDSEGFAVGIDLGTTYSCVALYQEGRVKILTNDEGNLTSSSCVALTDTVRLIGDEAKTQVVLNPEHTIFNSKRMIGRKFNDPQIQQDLQYWQFKVVNKLSKPKIRAEFEGATTIFTPEEISAMVLTDMKEIAEMYAGKKVTDVVISVPACFNDSQRQATKNAARIAGLNVIKLITEPAAAAVAYRAENKCKGTKNVLIYDLGGGTLDVSVINISEDWQFEVKTTAGDSHLGGEDFDNVLVEHFVEEFKTKHQRDLRTCPKALSRLRIECEYAKCALSSCLEVRIDINCLFGGISFHSKLTRVQFEDLCNDLFQSTLKLVKRALFDAEMAKGSIDEVVLVGLSTRIPKIRELLKDFFDGKEPKHLVSISPDEAVVYGAAVQAAVLTGLADEKLDSFRLVDVSPYSLLIETDKGVMSTLIHRNSQIPCVATKVFSTEVDNQCSIVIEVYEGEHATAKDNRLLGTFCVEGIPPALKGVPQVQVKFQLDANGILDVSAESSKTPRIAVTADKGGLSIYELDEMQEVSTRCEKEKAVKRHRDWVIEELVSYVYSVKLMVEYTSDYALSESDRDMALVICDAFLVWIEDNPLQETGRVLHAIKRAKDDLSIYIDMVERERVR